MANEDVSPPAPAHQPLVSSMDEVVDVTVLGAGVVGMATAYAAARRGLSVRLIDRASAPAMGASFANGSQLSYAYTDALASSALWKKLPALAFGLDPVFRMRWRADPAFLKWGLAFLGQATAARFRANTLAVLKLALESQAAMHALLARHAIDFHYAAPGKIHLYHDATSLAQAAAVVSLKHAQGVEQHVLGAREALALEPALAGAEGLAGAVYSPHDEVGDPHRFCVGLLALLESGYGMQVALESEVVDLTIQSDGVVLKTSDQRQLKSRRLIVCAGVGSTWLARKFRAPLALMPMKGYSFTAPLGHQPPAISITDTKRKLVFCRLGEHIRVAGLAELGAGDPRPSAAQSELLERLAHDSLPAAARYDAIESRWAGLRPMTPSSVPVITQVQPGIVFNAGHGMLGWTLAMGAGERAVALLMGERDSAPV